MEADIEHKRLAQVLFCDITKEEEMTCHCDPNPSHTEQHQALHSNNHFCPEICFSQQVMATFLSKTNFADKLSKENIEECLGIDETKSSCNCPLSALKLTIANKKTLMSSNIFHLKVFHFLLQLWGWKECDSSCI